MISGTARLALLQLAHVPVSASVDRPVRAAEQTAADSTITPVQYALIEIDFATSAVAGLVLAVVVAWWLARSRRDPLRAVPQRPNHLREDGLVLAVMIYLAAMLVLSGLVDLLAIDRTSAVASIVVGTGAQASGLIACLIVAAGRFTGGTKQYLIGAVDSGSCVASGLTLLLILLSIGLCPIVLQATVAVVQYYAPNYVFESHPTIQAMQDGDQPLGVLTALWIGAAVIAPVAEELFFRGLLQTYLVTLLKRRWAAIVVAGVFFGLAHVSNPHHIPALILLAMMMGYAYERTGSLLPPIVIHAAFNLKTLVWNALGGFPA